MGANTISVRNHSFEFTWISVIYLFSLLTPASAAAVAHHVNHIVSKYLRFLLFAFRTKLFAQTIRNFILWSILHRIQMHIYWFIQYTHLIYNDEQWQQWMSMMKRSIEIMNNLLLLLDHQQGQTIIDGHKNVHKMYNQSRKRRQKKNKLFEFKSIGWLNRIIMIIILFVYFECVCAGSDVRHASAGNKFNMPLNEVNVQQQKISI